MEPLTQGESREENRRVLFVLPLVITFGVRENPGEVRVLNVRHAKRRAAE